jgi:hypothetical protein
MTTTIKSDPELSPALNIEGIRFEMKQQRQLIEDQLTEANDKNNTYPRSMTMRFLKQKLGLTVFAEVSTFLLGARFLKSMSK